MESDMRSEAASKSRDPEIRQRIQDILEQLGVKE